MEFLVYSISNLGFKPKFEIVYANLTEANARAGFYHHLIIQL